MSAIERIEAERRRQIEAEGWTPEHDDAHRDGELFNAGMCYFLHAVGKLSYYPMFHHEDLSPARAALQKLRPMAWPWEAQWWKPKGAIRNLERSGALMLAEKDRLERLGLSFGHVDHKLNLVIAELDRLMGLAASTPTSAGGRDG